jgi:hypothetical protein
MLGSCVLLAVLAAAPDARATSAASATSPCTRGASTTLELEVTPPPGPPRHDGPGATTRIVLRRQADGSVLASDEQVGSWRCLGRPVGKRGYVLGIVRQRAGWSPLGSIVYLPEDAGAIVPSAFVRGRYLALAVAASPSGRHVVFVGGKGEVDGLYALDVERDEVRKLGPAPAPPPSPSLRKLCGKQPLGWGACWADGLVELEKKVLRFEPADVLVATYGKDTQAGRARARRTRRFNLAR